METGGGGGEGLIFRCEYVLSGAQVAKPSVTLVHLHLNPLAYRAVDITFSSCLVNDTSRWGINQLGSLFGSIFLLFLTKVGRIHIHNGRGKSRPLALSECPRNYLTSLYSTFFKGNCLQLSSSVVQTLTAITIDYLLFLLLCYWSMTSNLCS